MSDVNARASPEVISLGFNTLTVDLNRITGKVQNELINVVKA